MSQPFEVLVGERHADVGGAKRQAMLAMLALRRGRVVAVGALIDGVWGRSCRRLRGTRCIITSPASAPPSGGTPSSARPTATP